MFLLFIIEVLALFLVNSNNPETSVAKSTLTLWPRVVFHVRGLKQWYLAIAIQILPWEPRQKTSF